jgi:hypothetical protein
LDINHKFEGGKIMTFRVDYHKTFNHGDYLESGGGVLKSGFKTSNIKRRY